jgi:hypothetical protein
MLERADLEVSLRAERDRWFSLAFTEAGRKHRDHSYSTSALLYEIDIRAAFRGGAWLSVIVLAAAAIEAQFRHVYTNDYDSKAIVLYGENEELNWLRELRNEILHVSKPGTKSSLWKHAPNDLQACQNALEPEAKRAISIMFRTIYVNGAT